LKWFDRKLDAQRTYKSKDGDMYNIMILSDEHTNNLMTKYVESLNKTVELSLKTYTCEKKAKDALVDANTTLIIIDIGMTDIDGFELIQFVVDTLTIPVIAISSCVLGKDITEAVLRIATNLGASHVMFKSELIKNISELISSTFACETPQK